MWGSCRIAAHRGQVLSQLSKTASPLEAVKEAAQSYSNATIYQPEGDRIFVTFWCLWLENTKQESSDKPFEFR